MAKNSKPARLPWEPAGVINTDENPPAQSGKKAPDKGGALNLETENAFHNKGLMEGQNEHRGKYYE